MLTHGLILDCMKERLKLMGRYVAD